MNVNTPAAHAGQEQQRAIISTSELLSNLHLGFDPAEDGEPEEPLDKLNAIIHLISGCQDPSSDKFTIPEEHVGWALSVATDLIKDIQRRINDHREHLSTTWQELEHRLNACHILSRDVAKWVPMKSGQVVRK
ncbi:MAG: hypothetical protein PHI97_31760 [Desulfobulbus sp.]|nr:hypothetical protein [Desulfobulbus sp.]